MRLMNFLEHTDKQVKDLISAELRRQRECLVMIPSENFVSPAVLEATGCVATNKYSEGYPGKRYYTGNEVIDRLEETCQQRACTLFGVAHANVQALSGSPANLAIYFALLEPGDTIMGMELAQGGHLTHGYSRNFSGRFYHNVNYGVNRATELLDYDSIRDIARREKPKIIVCGATAYPRLIDFKKFRLIADEVGAYLLADISHIAGLVIAEVHPSPVPYADIIMTTTHKTLRGPRGAIIMIPRLEDRHRLRCRPDSKKDLAQLIDTAIIPGLQGGPHDHQTAAIAVALKEASRPEFKIYGQQIVKNAKALAASLTEAGLRLVSGGTDNHLILLDVQNTGLNGHEAALELAQVGISTNKNMIPFDLGTPLKPSGVRLGTPALTTRGFNEEDMRLVGATIADVLHHPTSDDVKKRARETVRELTSIHPLYPELN